MKQQKFDVFISYRRKGGDATARLFYERLTAMGYRVSYDVETLRSGKFNTQLYTRIEECKDVVAIMSADSLELRENIEDDWFRLEIAHALKCGKNMVPVFLRDFKMPESGSLPADIAELPNFQGVTSSDEHFDSVLKKLCRLLKSRPLNKLKKVISAAVASVLLITAVTSLYCYRGELFAYPFTESQKNEVKSWVGQMVLLGTAYNDYIAAQKDLLRSAKNSVEAGSRMAYDDAVPLFERRVKEARQKFDASAVAIKGLLEEPDCMPTDIAGVPVFLQSLAMEFEGAILFIGSLERIADPARPCAKHDRYKYLDLKSREIENYSEAFAYSVMGVFYKVSPDALGEFVKIAGEWAHIPHLGETAAWVSDETAIQQKLEKTIMNLKEVVGELQTIVGNETALLAQEEKDFEKLMASVGVPQEDVEKMIEASRYLSNLLMDENVTDAKLKTYRQKLIEAKVSPERADSMVKKVKENIELKKKLAESKESLAKTRARAAEKFAPKDDDDVGMLWGKTLRLMKLEMSDEAKKCMDVLRRRNVAEFPPAALDVAEAVFLAKTPLPFDGGLLVTLLEPPATSHAIYKIGDIITEVDGKPCRKFEDYKAKAGRVYTIYRRRADGSFQKLVSEMPEGQPRVMIINITEE